MRQRDWFELEIQGARDDGTIHRSTNGDSRSRRVMSKGQEPSRLEALAKDIFLFPNRGKRMQVVGHHPRGAQMRDRRHQVTDEQEPSPERRMRRSLENRMEVVRRVAVRDEPLEALKRRGRLIAVYKLQNAAFREGRDVLPEIGGAILGRGVGGVFPLPTMNPVPGLWVSKDRPSAGISDPFAQSAVVVKVQVGNYNIGYVLVT